MSFKNILAWCCPGEASVFRGRKAGGALALGCIVVAIK